MNLFELNVKLSRHDLHVMHNPRTDAYTLRKGDELILHVRTWDAFVNAMLIHYGKADLNVMLGTAYKAAVMRNLSGNPTYADICTDALWQIGYEIIFESGGYTLASGGHPIFHCQNWDIFYRQLLATVGTEYNFRRILEITSLI